MKRMSKLIVSKNEIDLSKTLMMGQAFRWIQVEPDVFRGVIGDQLFHLRVGCSAKKNENNIFYGCSDPI